MLITKVEASQFSKPHLETEEQLHCFIMSIVKLTSIPQQVADSKKMIKKERNGEKLHTRSKMK